MFIPDFNEAQERVIQELCDRLFDEEVSVFTSAVEIGSYGAWNGYKLIYALLTQVPADEIAGWVAQIDQAGRLE